MRIAVLSDIHANYHALEAVLAAVDAEGADEIWCLGDTVGYGPRPNRCCAIVRERSALCLAGNHDLAVIGTLSVDEFNGDAAAAVRWTQEVLEDDARASPGSNRPQPATASSSSTGAHSTRSGTTCSARRRHS
jgi:predicted phosphodiesterase